MTLRKKIAGILLTAVLISICMPAMVFAEGENIAEGTCGTCNWVIDANGKLIVSEGVLDEWNYDGPPWLSKIEEIRSVEFSGPVKAKTCQHMFGDLNKYNYIRTIDFANLDTSEVKDMKYMFSKCACLETLDISGLDTSNVTSMFYMFASFSGESIEFGNIDTSNVTDMDGMFDCCCYLTSLDLSSFNTSNVQSMYGMFRRCESLEELDLSHFDTSCTRWMDDMFLGCKNLRILDLSGLDASHASGNGGGSVTGVSDFFNECESLQRLTIGKGFGSRIKFPVAMEDTDTGITYEAGEKFPSVDYHTFVAVQPVQEEVYHLITFKPNGGSCDTTNIDVLEGDICGKLPIPERSGYYFKGWYTKKSGGTKITESSIITEDIEVYAQWDERKSLAKAKVTVGSPTYDGTAKKPAVTVKLNNKALKKGTDYKVTYSNNINASSKAVARITGINKYKGSVTKYFTIRKHSMDKNSVTGQVAKSSYEYTGKHIKPGITVYFKGRKMKKGTDYKVSYLYNKEPGKAYVEVTGMGNFTNTARLFGFTITKATQPFTTSVTSLNKAHRYIGTSSTITVSGVKEFAKVTVSSSNTKVAKVTKTLTGKYSVKFTGVGEAKISFRTAATKHYKATLKTVKVKVNDRKEPTLRAEQTEYKLEPVKGSSFNLNITTNSDGVLGYKSSNTQIASVSKKGKVTLTGEIGETVITITVPQTNNYKKKTIQVTIATYRYPHLNYITNDLINNPFFQYDTGDHLGDCAIASIAILRTMRGNGKTAEANYNDVWNENGCQSWIQSWQALGLTEDYDVSLEHIYQIMSERHTPVVIHRYNDNNTHFSVIYAYVGDMTNLEKSGFLVYDVKDEVYNNNLADDLSKWDNYRGEGFLQKIVY